MTEQTEHEDINLYFILTGSLDENHQAVIYDEETRDHSIDIVIQPELNDTHDPPPSYEQCT